ncbi:MAG TPA: MazG family protein [Frankiaceae bacterium]|nr:MazG family protein [Frankiaceae bacterium]
MSEPAPAEHPATGVTAANGATAPTGSTLLEAVAVMDRLRSPGGCPWDAEQTHQSLAPYLLEEAYEAYQALEDEDSDSLRDELGDVLLQVLFHARVAAEEPGGWDIDDVAAGLVAKLVRRHPHVFADTQVSGSADVEANWDRIKKAEQPGRSVADGVPLALPALALLAKLQSRGTRAGSWSPPADPASLVTAAADAAASEATEENVADLLLATVILARRAGLDPEAVLRRRALQFRDELAGSAGA